MNENEWEAHLDSAQGLGWGEIPMDADDEFRRMQDEDDWNAQTRPLSPTELRFRRSLIVGMVILWLAILGAYQAIRIALAVTGWLFGIQ